MAYMKSPKNGCVCGSCRGLGVTYHPILANAKAPCPSCKGLGYVYKSTVDTRNSGAADIKPWLHESKYCLKTVMDGRS